MAAARKKKTLLLVFIHGFKGGEDTFGPDYAFAKDLRTTLLERHFIASSSHHVPNQGYTQSADPRIQQQQQQQNHQDTPTNTPSPAEPPLLAIETAIYPRYETRGDLSECVSRFRDWLLERVIDIEVASSTPSPTIDPSVRVVLCGHSMGGIVAAETVIALTSDQPVPFASSSGGGGDGGGGGGDAGGDGGTGGDKGGKAGENVPQEGKSTTGAPASTTTTTTTGAVKPSLNSMPFPYVQGVLAFDTPYLGISPGVVAHGAEGHYNTASQAVTQLSGLGAAVSGLWGTTGGGDGKGAGAAPGKKPIAALPAPPTNNNSSTAGSWGNWGKLAMYAGAGAVAVGGAAAAYMKRDELTQGFTWVSSHLAFVGCLARGEELRRRVAYMALVEKKLGIGFGNIYTRLGKGADAAKGGSSGSAGGGGGGGRSSMVSTMLGKDRTFCNLPTKQPAGTWLAAVNDLAEDETSAHMGMFEPKLNPNYQALCEDAAGMIAGWVDKSWYIPMAQIEST